MEHRSKCFVCETRPRQNDSRFCSPCSDRIAADIRSKQKPQADKYLHYRGHWIGLFANGTDEDGIATFKAKYLCYAPLPAPEEMNAYLRHGIRPKSPKFRLAKTLNLDKWIEGFTRQQIKLLKAGVKRLTPVMV